VLVKGITNRPDSEREEDDAKTTKVGPSSFRQRRKVQDATYITLPYLPDAVVTVDDMLEKVPKLRYSVDNVPDANKFLYLAEETYLTNTREIGPLGKPIME